MGATLMTGVVWAVNLQMLLLTEHFTSFTYLCLAASIVLWYLFLIIMSYLPASFSTNYCFLFPELIGPSAAFWLTGTILLPVVGVLPYFIYRAVRSQLHPRSSGGEQSW